MAFKSVREWQKKTARKLGKLKIFDEQKNDWDNHEVLWFYDPNLKKFGIRKVGETVGDTIW